MKAMRVAVAVAIVLSAITVNVSGALFKVKVKGIAYTSSQGGEVLQATPVTGADFISLCTATPGAQLVAEVEDFETVPTAILTVDACGTTLLCTNLTISRDCEQDGATSNGSSESAASATAISVAAPGNTLTGTAFLLTKGVGSPTNSAAVTSYSAKGPIILCSTNGDVVSLTITISGALKAGKGCQ
ncbi:MAG TPA: hypothetical protein VLZ30_12775 [Verrucomicrobiae bacterium]|nr:hypothetical protein [Verrucomicrobiae bacterium]